MLEIVVGNIQFLTNIKKTKETKNFSDIGFISIITKNAKLKYPEICAQNWHVIIKLYIFFKTNLLLFLKVDIPI